MVFEGGKPPAWHQLRLELMEPTYKIVNGRAVAESEDGMKKRGLKSPNLADALNTTFYQDYDLFRESYIKTENLPVKRKKKPVRSWKSR